MKIDNSNAHIISSKKAYIHDDVLETLMFERNKKEISLNMIDYSGCKKYTIVYKNVIGFFMTSCDFWGESSRILDFELVDSNDSIITSKLFKYKIDNGFVDSSPENYNNYIETVITFVSGDKLEVACKCIVLEK